jgi:methionine-rich copper-binding protein CopC
MSWLASRAALLGLALAPAACAAHAYFVPTNPAPRALVSRSPAGIELFSSGPPSRPHVDVGFVEFVGPTSDEGEALRLLRYEGAAHGCDALVVSFKGHTAEPYATCVVYVDAR